MFKLYVTLLLVSLTAALASQDAQSLMQAVDESPRAKTRSATMSISIESRGQRKERQLKSFTQEIDEQSQSLFFVSLPASLKNSAYLVEREPGESRIMIYLPALKRPKRLSGGDERKPFLSSDLSYADLQRSYWQRDYQLKWLKSDTVDGRELQLIEAIPDAEESQRTGYSKVIAYVDPEIAFVRRLITYQKETVKFIQFKQVKQIDGFWTAQHIQVLVRKGQKTVGQTTITLSEIGYNQELPVKFEAYQLSKGAP